MSQGISRKQQVVLNRQATDVAALDAATASYAPRAARVPDQNYLDRLDGWCIRTRLKLNSVMSQELIDALGAQLAGKTPLEQKPIIERWADAFLLEGLAAVFEQEGQGFSVPLCHKIAGRLRNPDRHPLNIEYATREAIGLAAAYRRHRHIIEGLYLATPDVLYTIATRYGDENDVPFLGKDGG